MFQCPFFIPAKTSQRHISTLRNNTDPVTSTGETNLAKSTQRNQPDENDLATSDRQNQPGDIDLAKTTQRNQSGGTNPAEPTQRNQPSETNQRNQPAKPTGEIDEVRKGRGREVSPTLWALTPRLCAGLRSKMCPAAHCRAHPGPYQFHPRQITSYHTNPLRIFTSTLSILDICLWVAPYS